MEEHFFRWDEIRWGKVTEKDKKRITEFVTHNYDPKLSLSAKVEKVNPETVKIIDKKNTFLLILEADKGNLNVNIAEKIDELIVRKDIDKKDSKEFTVYSTNSAQGQSNKFAGSIGIVLTLTYFFLCLQSFCWYEGNHDLVMGCATYILLPVIGAFLGPIFYITILRGLFLHIEAPPIKSTFGFIAISALADMFSVQAALKLCDIFYSMFTKPSEGKIQDSR